MSLHLCSQCLETWRDPKPSPPVERRELLRPCPRCVEERRLVAA